MLAPKIALVFFCLVQFANSKMIDGTQLMKNIFVPDEIRLTNDDLSLQCFRVDYFIEGLLSPLNPFQYTKSNLEAEFKNVIDLWNTRLNSIKSNGKINCSDPNSLVVFSNTYPKNINGMNLVDAAFMIMDKNYVLNYPKSCHNFDEFQQFVLKLPTLNEPIGVSISWSGYHLKMRICASILKSNNFIIDDLKKDYLTKLSKTARTPFFG